VDVVSLLLGTSSSCSLGLSNTSDLLDSALDFLLLLAGPEGLREELILFNILINLGKISGAYSL